MKGTWLIDLAVPLGSKMELAGKGEAFLGQVGDGGFIGIETLGRDDGLLELVAHGWVPSPGLGDLGKGF